MRRSLPAGLGVALLGLGALVGFTVEPRRLADASTYLLMTDSLWMDGDLTCAPADAARAEVLGLAEHPRGVFLVAHPSGTFTYAKPLLYAVAAVPFYALFGVQGFFVLNGVLLGALLWLGTDIVTHRIRWPAALALVTIVIAASVTVPYLIWIDQFLLCSALIAATVAAFRRGALASSAMLLTLAASCRPPYLALAAAPALLCALERRWRPLVRFAAAGVATGVVVLAANAAVSGEWSPYSGERFYYPDALPVRDGGPPPRAIAAEVVPAGGRLPDPAALARTTMELAIGRFAGLLPYFPGLLICVVWSRRWDREKRAWLAGLAASCAALIVVFPHNTMGGQHALGNRLFVLLPVALVWIEVAAWSRWRVAATLALLLLAAPIVLRPVQLSERPGAQMTEWPYRLFPVEWSQALRIRFPIQFPHRMAALSEAQFQWEGSGVWTRGGETATFVFLRLGSEPAPRLRLWTHQPRVAVVDGGVARVLDWNAAGEAQLTLAHPVARYRDESSNGMRVAVYTLRVGTPTGSHGYEVGSPTDPRYLGVFVQPLH